jgi:hypothetical protein
MREMEGKNEEKYRMELGWMKELWKKRERTEKERGGG